MLDTSLDAYLETPMHHLFEGIIKSLLEITTTYLKFSKCWSKYCECINPLMDDINALRLDYCHVEAFWYSKTDYKATGWIAENYLGYARIIVILLIHIEDIMIDEKKAFKEFKSMIQTAFVLISHLMTRSSVDVTLIEELVKIFLWTCHMFDTTFGYSDINIPFFCSCFLLRKNT